MIVVGATMHVVDGKGDEFIKEFRKVAPKVRKDPGALLYALHRDIADPNRFFFYEKYENEEAIKFHGSAPHVREFFQAIGPITTGRPEIVRYQEVT
jgi:quinol monooxygenase YgiN